MANGPVFNHPQGNQVMDRGDLPREPGGRDFPAEEEPGPIRCAACGGDLDRRTKYHHDDGYYCEGCDNEWHVLNNPRETR